MHRLLAAAIAASVSPQSAHSLRRHTRSLRRHARSLTHAVRSLPHAVRSMSHHAAPICFRPISPLTRLGYLLFYLTLASHLIVFPLYGYRAPRGYALYLFAIYGTLLIASCLIDRQQLSEEWLCAPFAFIFNECDREQPPECSAPCADQ